MSRHRPRRWPRRWPSRSIDPPAWLAPGRRWPPVCRSGRWSRGTHPPSQPAVAAMARAAGAMEMPTPPSCHPPRSPMVSSGADGASPGQRCLWRNSARPARAAEGRGPAAGGHDHGASGDPCNRVERQRRVGMRVTSARVGLLAQKKSATHRASRTAAPPPVPMVLGALEARAALVGVWAVRRLRVRLTVPQWATHARRASGSTRVILESNAAGR